MTELEQRKAVVAEATEWERMRTPFVDCQRVKGLGTDCGGILCEIYPKIKPEIGRIDPGQYSPQHMLHSDEEFYIAQLLRYCREIPESEAKMGDIVMYKFGHTFSHSGIIVDRWPGEIINAVKGSGVIKMHGTKDGLLKERKRRFFSPWAK
jgi:hypothetical protein